MRSTCMMRLRWTPAPTRPCSCPHICLPWPIAFKKSGVLSATTLGFNPTYQRFWNSEREFVELDTTNLPCPCDILLEITVPCSCFGITQMATRAVRLRLRLWQHAHSNIFHHFAIAFRHREALQHYHLRIGHFVIVEDRTQRSMEQQTMR